MNLMAVMVMACEPSQLCHASCSLGAPMAPSCSAFLQKAAASSRCCLAQERRGFNTGTTCIAQEQYEGSSRSSDSYRLSMCSAACRQMAHEHTSHADLPGLGVAGKQVGHARYGARAGSVCCPCP